MRLLAEVLQRLPPGSKLPSAQASAINTSATRTGPQAEALQIFVNDQSRDSHRQSPSRRQVELHRLLRRFDDDFMAEQRHVGQLVTGLQALVEIQHRWQITRFSADPHLPLAGIRGQGQQGNIVARHAFEHRKQTFPRAAQLLRDLAHFGEVLRLLAGFGRAQGAFTCTVAGELALRGLQMTLLLFGLGIEMLCTPRHSSAAHTAAERLQPNGPERRRG